MIFYNKNLCTINKELSIVYFELPATMKADIDLEYMTSNHRFRFVSSTDELERAPIFIFAIKLQVLDNLA